MNLWEIMKACAERGYVGGESFKSDTGQEIYFDGQRLVGIEKADLNSKWHFVEPNKKAAS